MRLDGLTDEIETANMSRNQDNSLALLQRLVDNVPAASYYLAALAEPVPGSPGEGEEICEVQRVGKEDRAGELSHFNIVGIPTGNQTNIGFHILAVTMAQSVGERSKA